MPRFIGEFSLSPLRTGWLERATIIDDSLSHCSAISLDLIPTGGGGGWANVWVRVWRRWQYVALEQQAGPSYAKIVSYE
jgi:hypothetical protein